MEKSKLNRMTLDELGVLHKTDQSSLGHGYFSILERYFEPVRLTATRVVEIGVAGGNSLRVWSDYFENAQIVGVDHNAEFVRSLSDRLPPRTQVVLGDATDAQTWDSVRGVLGDGIDACIEDGGHFSHQIITAFILGWPLLNSGGIWCIEDTHFVYANEEGVTARLWAWLETKIHEMNELGRGQCARPTVSDIAFIHLYKSLIVIGKR